MNEPTRMEWALGHIRETLHIGLQDATLDGEAGRERIAAWADFIDCEIRSAVTASEPPRHPAESSPEPPAGPERSTGEAGPEKGAQAATLRDAPTSIRTIADHMPGRHPEFVRGVRYAATLLSHTADDLTEGAAP